MSDKVIKTIKALPPSLTYEIWLNTLKNRPLKFPCFALNAFCVLNANGDILPCLNHFDQPGGNVRQKTPTEIWQSAQMQKIRKTVKECPGCLNSWGTSLSFAFDYFPVLKFYLAHPNLIIKKIGNKKK